MADASMTSADRQPPASVSWPFSSALLLGALPTAAPCARLHARHVLNEWGLARLGDTVELLVSELVTNAIQASQLMAGPASPPVHLRLFSDGTVVLIEVWDDNPYAPELKTGDLNADCGRGLILVGALSTRWNWYFPPEGPGKVVWAEVGA